jgi:hypothetical protein
MENVDIVQNAQSVTFRLLQSDADKMGEIFISDDL